MHEEMRMNLGPTLRSVPYAIVQSTVRDVKLYYSLAEVQQHYCSSLVVKPRDALSLSPHTRFPIYIYTYKCYKV
ncbi:hypothetical protein RND71_007099 [Anisodus tanguticus]|uniref:Uncharacterized protein n=1 Tax=Anisodus tanguticus TaxID=243964 RepID=A0AAE1SKR5_9SOLA|nr:hypothetical protein RND71_007099 [Anisodus tanguticus]